MDNAKIHPVFENAPSLISTPEEEELFMQILIMASRLLYWEKRLRIRCLLLFATRKTQLAEGLYMYSMASNKFNSPGGLHKAVQDRLAAMASHLEFCWQEDPGRGEDGSATLIGPRLCRIDLNVELRNRFLRAQPGTSQYNACLMRLAITLVHELAHAAIMLRPDYNESELCIQDGCETSEEGFELENALWGGMLTELDVKDPSGHVAPVFGMLQWPDSRTIAAYDGNVGSGRIHCRSVPREQPWRFVQNQFLETLVESRADAVLRRPGSKDLGEYCSQ